MRTFAFVLCVALAPVGSPDPASAPRPAPSWPTLRSLDTTIAVRTLDSKAWVRLPLRDVRGRVAYTLNCRGGSPPAADDDYSSDSLWIASVFTCRLDLGDSPGSVTDKGLLFSDDSPFWHTRGFMPYQQLPALARVGTRFRLRGFEMRLRFRNLVGAGVHLRRFDMRVTVRPDAHIRSALLETSDVRMCRNWTDSARIGSWQPCATLTPPRE